ncbi:MAG: protein kinase domain-containing protein [Anaerolineae bacterium]
MEDLVGKILDNAYRVDKLLGEGGMGAVYKGHDVALDRDVAIKVMHPHVARQEGFRERFLQEARAIAVLDHPDIVQVHSFSRNTDLLYIVMSFISGQNLRDWEQTLAQRGQMMALSDSLSMVAEIANALDYAHRRGVFHRDIKPGNIILRPLEAGETNKDGLPFQPIVTDFGLAKLAEGGMLSMTGMAMGTPTYMSPEQCEGKTVDGRTDIYALGIVLYELVTGRVPFNVKTLTEAIHAHTQEPPPPPRSINPSIPSQVEEIILKALAKSVDQRYASASQMEQALRAASSVIPQSKATEATVGGAAAYVSMTTLVGQGVAQATPSKDNWPTPPSAIPVGGRVLVLSPDGQSKSIAIGDRKQLVIGRDPGVDVMLSDTRVSRRHAQVVFDGLKYDVTDLNSTNGTFLDNNRLLPGVPETWRPGQSLRVGDHWLRLELQGAGPQAQPRVAPSSFPAQQAPQGTLQSPGIQAGGSLINASLEPDQLAVRPGEHIDCTVCIMNGQALVDHFSVQVDGIPADWVKRPDIATRLAPGDVGTITLRLSPPKLSASTAGQHPFTVRVLSQVNPSQPVILPGQLEVLPFYNLNVGLQPSTFTNKGQGQVTLVNQGNAAETVALTGADPSGTLLVGTPPGQVAINPGEQRTVALTVRSKGRRPLVGNTAILPFMINALNTRGEKQTTQGTIMVKPYLPAWALPILMMVVLALCGGTVLAFNAWKNDQSARSTATAVVIANSTAVVVSTAQVIETKTAQAIVEAKTGAAMSESEKKTATAASISEAKTATQQAASEAKTATAQSESEAKTASAMGASEAKTAAAQKASDDKTATAQKEADDLAATANAPTATPTPTTPPEGPTKAIEIRPIIPIGKLIDIKKLLFILPDWSDEFAKGVTTGWSANPAGVASLDGAELVLSFADNDAWYIQKTSVKDFTYVGKLTMSSGIGAGLAFRSNTDGSKDYEVYLDFVNKRMMIAKRPWQVLAWVPVELVLGTTYTVRVETKGADITAAIDDMSISVSTTDTSYTQGYFGLHVYRGKARFSNIMMYW